MTCIASNDGKCIGISFVCMNGPVCIESEEVEPPCQSPACDLDLSACICGEPFGHDNG